MKPLAKIPICWSKNLAYAIGLITADGNLSKDKRHIIFVSKDIQLIKTFKRCLGLQQKVCQKNSGYAPTKKYFFVQFGDVHFYNFLLHIGLRPSKSKTLREVKVPQRFFFDFLRGLFDGDGSIYSYWDKRWKSSFLFYAVIASASNDFIIWLQKKIYKLAKIHGHITKCYYSEIRQLKYAKREAKILLKKMYYSKKLPMLKRKYIKTCSIIKTDR